MRIHSTDEATGSAGAEIRGTRRVWGGGTRPGHLGNPKRKMGVGADMPIVLATQYRTHTTNKGKHDEGGTFTDRYHDLADLAASTGGKVLPPAR